MGCFSSLWGVKEGMMEKDKVVCPKCRHNQIFITGSYTAAFHKETPIGYDIVICDYTTLMCLGCGHEFSLITKGNELVEPGEDE